MLKILLSLSLGLLLTAGVQAEDLKVGFVNVPRVLEKAPQAEAAKKDLEREFSPRDKRLVAEQKELKALEEKIARDAAVMSEAEMRKLEKSFLSKKREARRSQEEFRDDFNMRRNDELSKLQKGIFEAIRAIAKEENFDLLLTDGVVYASDKIDITAKVQKRLNSMSLK